MLELPWCHNDGCSSRWHCETSVVEAKGVCMGTGTVHSQVFASSNMLTYSRELQLLCAASHTFSRVQTWRGTTWLSHQERERYCQTSLWSSLTQEPTGSGWDPVSRKLGVSDSPQVVESQKMRRSTTQTTLANTTLVSIERPQLKFSFQSIDGRGAT